jgi:hypothetical protein
MATLTMTTAQATERVRAVCQLLAHWGWNPTPNQAAVAMAALTMLIRDVDAGCARVDAEWAPREGLTQP